MENRALPSQVIRSIVPLMQLAFSLSLDRRVPWETKTAFGLAALYVISPIDAIPDIIPVIGWAEDIVIILLMIDGMVNHLDPVVVREHWKGQPEMLETIQKLARKATGFIPKSIREKVYKSAFRGKASWATPAPKVVDAG